MQEHMIDAKKEGYIVIETFTFKKRGHKLRREEAYRYSIGWGMERTFAILEDLFAF